MPDFRPPGLYRRAAVLALPSVDRSCYGRDVPVWELLGLVALEGMASGTLVVASRIGDLAEVVQRFTWRTCAERRLAANETST